jgi:hypothetical protein
LTTRKRVERRFDHVHLFIGKLLIPGLMAFGLALAPVGALAAEPHAHAANVEMRLDQGNKWPTDEVLRRGMEEIRLAMAGALNPIHRNEFSAGAYDALAARVQTQVDDVIANCQLPEEADQQLHIVLEQILDGVAAMKGETGRAEGAIKLVQALDLYGRYFEHAGWQPLAH